MTAPVIDNGIASHEEACEIRPSWNAAVCRGDMGRFGIAGDFDEFGIGPIADPIILQRNGRRFEYIGETTIGSGAELRVETGRDSLSLSLREMDQASFVILELPGFAASAGGAQKDSLSALREASETAYFQEGDTLWVKLVVEDAAADGPVVVRVGNLRAQATIDVSKEALPSTALVSEAETRRE